MKTPLEVIESFGVPSNSIVAAIHQINDPDHPVVLTKRQYEKSIVEIIGGDHPPSYSNEKEARLYFLYTIQETIRAFQNGVPDMEDVWMEVQRRATTFLEKAPWTIKDYGTEDVVEGEQPKRRKGAKKDIAEAIYKEMNDGKNDRPAIIDALIEQAEMTKAGATTYFHNLRKQFGFKGPKTERKKREPKVLSSSTEAVGKKTVKRTKGPSKGAIAREVYMEMKGQPKDKIIAEIVNRSGTTPAGANTYFCSCKKELGE